LQKAPLFAQLSFKRGNQLPKFNLQTRNPVTANQKAKFVFIPQCFQWCNGAHTVSHRSPTPVRFWNIILCINNTLPIIQLVLLIGVTPVTDVTKLKTLINFGNTAALRRVTVFDRLFQAEIFPRHSRDLAVPGHLRGNPASAAAIERIRKKLRAGKHQHS
jgi:hypothetical protein